MQGIISGISSEKYFSIFPGTTIKRYRVGVGLVPTRNTMKQKTAYPKRPDRLRLSGFDYSSKATYFLTICTRDKKPIFADKTKIRIVNNVADLVEKRLNIPILAMCIMPDHLHLIIHNLGDNSIVLADFVKEFKSRIYSEFRKKFGLLRSFWQRYYYDHIIRDDRDFDEKFHFIMQNPVKAGLTNVVCDPDYVYVNMEYISGRRKVDPYAEG